MPGYSSLLPPLTIAILDNRPMFTSGLKQALEREAHSVLEASDWAELEEKRSDTPLDLLLFSAHACSDQQISLPLDSFRLHNKSCKVVMYGYRNPISSLLPFFHGRIQGYLPETFTPIDLEACLRQLQSDQLYINTDLVYDLLLTRLADPTKKTVILSRMENTVADYLLKGMSISKIAELMNRKAPTISTVKKNIFRKTNVDNILDLARILKPH
ncbi:LuxR C-terminal-related transcriptional regulator [Siphonobacter sp. SORGH_AS_0500]|uniref:helix-turn-helix transcriptional regulator n=1 Tax=Siphonobacter sp. SORGH_AS_0500 TaxID=1864824 RepID=UPI0028606CFA|nr:LuxR C-terminal-related transcriptional regulator [Siphonobacter sp. SORGH_AS_0500]MDR6194615.1 DNA-binding NarL/FixJ family response regulator [Siphonobacter sp. SORGH_AS_0500]